MELEKRIKSVKERLGLQVPSDDDEELIKIKKELLASKKEHQLSTNSNRDESTEQNSSDRTRIVFNSESEPAQERRPIVLYSEPEQNPKQRNEHARIVFGSEAELRGKRKPVSERLGKKAGEENSSSNRTKIILNDIHREEDEILGHKEKSRRTRLVSYQIFCLLILYVYSLIYRVLLRG